MRNSKQKYLKFSLAFGLRNRRKDASRKDAKRAKFGEIENISFFAFLASWRDKFS
jgi:hypothetical protein